MMHDDVCCEKKCNKCYCGWVWTAILMAALVCGLLISCATQQMTWTAADSQREQDAKDCNGAKAMLGMVGLWVECK